MVQLPGGLVGKKIAHNGFNPGSGRFPKETTCSSILAQQSPWTEEPGDYSP